MVLARTIPRPPLILERSKMYRAADCRNAPYDSEEEEEEIPKDEEIREETIRVWCTQWDTAEKGRLTHRCIPDISRWMNREHEELSHHTIQALTGHGQFQSSQYLIGKASSPICVLCDSGAEDDPDQAVFQCAALQRERTGLGVTRMPERVRKMMEGTEEWERSTKILRCLMRKRKSSTGSGTNSSRPERKVRPRDVFHGVTNNEYVNHTGEALDGIRLAPAVVWL